MNPKSRAPIPEAITQLQRQLDQFRSTQPRRTKLPEPLWQAAVELAREYGIYSVAHPLRLDYRMPQWTQNAHPVEGIDAARVGQSAACLAGNGRMIQIAAQIRILVAVEAIDGRKGVDAMAQLCREKLNADPFSASAILLHGGYSVTASSRSAVPMRQSARKPALVPSRPVVQRLSSARPAPYSARFRTSATTPTRPCSREILRAHPRSMSLKTSRLAMGAPRASSVPDS